MHAHGLCVQLKALVTNSQPIFLSPVEFINPKSYTRRTSLANFQMLMLALLKEKPAFPPDMYPPYHDDTFFLPLPQNLASSMPRSIASLA